MSDEQPVGMTTAEAIAFGDGYNKGFAACKSERKLQYLGTDNNGLKLYRENMALATKRESGKEFLAVANAIKKAADNLETMITDIEASDYAEAAIKAMKEGK